LVEIWILEAVALVVVVHDVPEGLLRAVVKVGPRHEHVAEARCLERGDVGLLLRDEESTECRHVGLDCCSVNSARIVRVDELYGLPRQRDDVVADDTDADVMKVVVHEERDIPLVLRQRVTLVAAAAGVEELPAALGRVIDGVPVAGDEVIEGGIERNLRAFVGRDGAQQVGPVRYSLRCQAVAWTWLRRRWSPSRTSRRSRGAASA